MMNELAEKLYQEDAATAVKEIRRLQQRDEEQVALIASLREDVATLRRDSNRLKAIVQWLEDNQEDVFRRGIWDVIK